MYVPLDAKVKEWGDFTLIVPAVSVGNVGQLTADLLLSTFWCHKVGYFHDDSFLPMIGNDPFAHRDAAEKACHMVTAVEVYENEDHKLVIIQQRSPFVKGKQSQYVEKLMSWIRHCNFREVLILTSSHSHERRDSQLTGTQLRYLMTPALKESAHKVIHTNLNWVELEPRTIDDGSEGATGNSLFIPGGGISKKLYNLCEGAGINTGILLLFCAEGDNAADALALANYLNAWKDYINFQKSSDLKGYQGWKIPTSWKLMFGSRCDPVLFR